jgi:protein-tyrosine phosphatase
MSQRDIVLGNLFNVRDVGGYQTQSGRTVQWAKVYRAASLHQLDPEHQQDWDRLGLATVVDLRRPMERAVGGWPELLKTATLCELPILPDDWMLDRSGFPTPTDHLSAVYGDMARLGAEAIRATFELLSQSASYPLLFFCIAGKDRTGLLAAVLLSVLGVDDEQVLNDYEMSGERVEAMVHHLRATGRMDESNPMIRQPVEALRAPRAALAAALSQLRASYGSVEDYLLWCGVTSEQLDAVRQNLLAG